MGRDRVSSVWIVSRRSFPSVVFLHGEQKGSGAWQEIFRLDMTGMAFYRRLCSCFAVIVFKFRRYSLSIMWGHLWDEVAMPLTRDRRQQKFPQRDPRGSCNSYDCTELTGWCPSARKTAGWCQAGMEIRFCLQWPCWAPQLPSVDQPLPRISPRAIASELSTRQGEALEFTDPSSLSSGNEKFTHLALKTV